MFLITEGLITFWALTSSISICFSCWRRDVRSEDEDRVSLRGTGMVDELRFFVFLLQLSKSEGDSLPSAGDTWPAGSASERGRGGVGGSMRVLEAGGAEMGQEGLNYECTIKSTSMKCMKHKRILNYSIKVFTGQYWYFLKSRPMRPSSSPMSRQVSLESSPRSRPTSSEWSPNWRQVSPSSDTKSRATNPKSSPTCSKFRV